ncbi:MAG: hypothetical protein WDM79_14280 [Terricaulis sp.]
MPSELIFTDLGDAGIDYVREHLAGVNVFCTALLAAVEAAPGKVITLAPRGVSQERLHAFGEADCCTPRRACSNSTRTARSRQWIR